MLKTTVYSWRMTSDLKLALEDAARGQGVSVAELLDRISKEWLTRASSADEQDEQRRLHAAASRHLGSLAGGDPDRSSRARETLRARLNRRREQAS